MEITMKSIMTMANKRLLKIIVLAATFLAVSCQRTQFAEVPSESQSSLSVVPDIPVDPTEPIVEPVPEPVIEPTPPVDPPPPPVTVVKPLPSYTNGPCAPDSSTDLTSCQKCIVPQNPVVSQFSSKGKSLIDIMAIGCSVPNKSAPAGYVPPTKAQLIERLNQLTPEIYPDSPMSALQIATIEGLKIDSNLQKKMFGKLWYQPPYSDAFETYFGIEVGEAVYQLCYRSPESVFTPYNKTPLVSKKMMDCMYGNNPSNCKESSDYIDGNVYRNQLRYGMIQSLTNPYNGSNPTSPAKQCAWEKFEGLYELGGAEQIGKWLVSGQKISMEVKGIGGKCASVSSIPTGSDIPEGEVILAAYVCK
jgi:hypothetical protein